MLPDLQPVGLFISVLAFLYQFHIALGELIILKHKVRSSYIFTFGNAFTEYRTSCFIIRMPAEEITQAVVVYVHNNLQLWTVVAELSVGSSKFRQDVVLD